MECAKTTVICQRCGESHPARIERSGHRELGKVECPHGERIVQLSSDARMYFAVRGTSWAARNLAVLRHMLASVGRGRNVEFLRHLAGFVSGRGRRGMMMLGVGEYCRSDFFDESRIAGCATREMTKMGAVSPCMLYSEFGKAGPES